ncbi:MAG: hypothetical protein II278_07445 [Bacteroidaceae bacterium]|nr:hypothetical protein [Bacteroidaceae bacterium]
MKKSKELWRRMGEWVEENGLIEDGGASLKSFLAYFSVSEDSYRRWLQIECFADIITRARATFRQNLERDIVVSLARAAKGYTYSEKHKKQIFEDNGKGQPIIKGVQQWEKEVSVAPNVQAATWLLPRLSERWNVPDKHDVNVTSPQGISIFCGDDEELAALHRQLKNQE